MTCLAKRPADRYPSAAALADALEALPPANDWRKADAITWWDAFRRSQLDGAVVSTTPTLTVTVDIGSRT